MFSRLFVKKFMVYTRGRTGSTAIVDEINRHPQIMCHQELFLPGSDQYDNLYGRYVAAGGEQFFEKKWAFEYGNPIQRRRAGIQDDFYKKNWPYIVCPFPLFLRVHVKVDDWSSLSADSKRKVLHKYWKYVSSYNKRRVKALGYKMMRHHNDLFSGVFDYQEKKNFSVIYLKRNPARMVISGMVAKQRNVYNSLDKQAIDAPMLLDAEEFEESIRIESFEINQELEYVDSSGLPYIVVDYEAFLTDRKRFFSEVFDFLGVDEWEPERTEYQVQIDDLRQTISNFDELAAVADKMGCPIGDQ